MGKIPGSPGAGARSNQLAANSATIITLLKLCPNPIALARVPEGIASQSIKPNPAAASPPMTPAAIIQKAISVHLVAPVSRWMTSKITDVVSNPSGKGTSIGCIGCPIAVTLLCTASTFPIRCHRPCLTSNFTLRKPDFYTVSIKYLTYLLNWR